MCEKLDYLRTVMGKVECPSVGLEMVEKPCRLSGIYLTVASSTPLMFGRKKELKFFHIFSALEETMYDWPVMSLPRGCANVKF